MMKHLRIGALIIFGVQFWAGLGTVFADETLVVSGIDQRQQLALTLYQNGLGLVDERRTITTTPVSERLVISGTSPYLIPGSAQLIAPGLTIRALDYRLSALSPRALLAASVGKEVGVIQTHPSTGEETIVRAQVLSVDEGIVLCINDRIETGIPGRLVFDDIPADLANSPAVVANIKPGTAYDGKIGLQYLSNGLGWHADHIAQVRETPSGVTLDLESWASIENNTDLAFNGASLALVAGSVNRTSQPQPQPKIRMETMAMVSAAAPSMGQPSREALGDFHLYTVPGTFDLGSDARTQILLSTQNNVAAEKAYVLRGHGQAFFGRAPADPSTAEHPQILYRFENSGSEPLAGGIVRLYGSDSEGIKRFLGEDHLASIATGERAELHAGQAFDLSAYRRQLSFRRSGANNTVFETTQEVTLRNAGAELAIMEIREPVFGDWKILEESHDGSRDGMEAVWKIQVPASGKVVLRYKIRIER